MTLQGLACVCVGGGGGGGGGSVPQSTLASLDPRMHGDYYAFVCVC